MTTEPKHPVATWADTKNFRARKARDDICWRGDHTCNVSSFKNYRDNIGTVKFKLILPLFFRF